VIAGQAGAMKPDALISGIVGSVLLALTAWLAVEACRTFTGRRATPAPVAV
jgi:hypothetical protein